MGTFGKLIRNEALTEINENPIEDFYEHPTPDEVAALLKQAAKDQAEQKIISPKTKER